MDDLRRLQLTQLEILDVIDNVCKRHHIHYSLYAGTLLGAIRHQGFIPWDDDLDVCMERSEYERFIKVWDEDRPEGYLLQNKNNTPGFTQSFTKIRKEHTTFLQFESERKKYHTGIFVDVFPIDRVPVKRISKVLFLWKCMRYQLLTREYIPPDAGKAVQWVSSALLFLIPKKKRKAVMERDLKYVKSFTNPRLPRIAIERMATLRVPLPSNLTDSFEERLFEKKMYPVFKEWDAYLRLKFGDYMTMPPESERIWQHHPIVLDFEHELKELRTCNQSKTAPIRILHVIGIMNRGGAESMIMDLYRHIDREKVQFDFVEHTPERATFDEEIERLGGHVFRCPHYNGKNHFQYVRWWNTFFKNHAGDYSVVQGHIGSTAAIYLNLAKKCGVYTIAHSHNTYGPISFRGTLYRLYSYRTRLIADSFFACSVKAGTDRFGKRIVRNQKRFRVLNNAIDTEQYAFRSSTRSEIRESLGLSEDAYVVGHVGRFVDQKNHEMIIDIFLQIYRLDPYAKLLLVGDGSKRAQIEEKVTKLGLDGKVIMTGVRNDVANLLQGMDVFLFPSKYEGLGVALIEAQAAGLPCVISDCIPKEVAVTNGLINTMSLDSSPRQWAERVLAMKNIKRVDHSGEVKTAGYDIWETTAWLEEFYLDKAKS